MNIDEFVALPVEEQRAMLRHPRWVTRCQCREYGFPWPQVQHLLTGSTITIRHTRTICAPEDEFLDDAHDIRDQ